MHHIRLERDPNRWAKDYDFPAMKKGLVKRQTIKLAIPSGMNALVFNTRRPVFADRNVREALTSVFDFEWINRNLYHNLYTRTRSFFDRSELSSGGKPVDEHEKSLLAKYPDAVTKAIRKKAMSPLLAMGRAETAMLGARPCDY